MLEVSGKCCDVMGPKRLTGGPEECDCCWLIQVTVAGLLQEDAVPPDVGRHCHTFLYRLSAWVQYPLVKTFVSGLRLQNKMSATNKAFF